jgi:glutamate-ammonia-ligase adenylyltransferase
MALTRARMLVADGDFGPRVDDAIKNIVGAPRDRGKVMSEVRAMRELIAQEKGDDNPWDLKLARGGLTDLDFVAQALVLAHGAEHQVLIGLPAEDVFDEARKSGLLGNEDAQALIEAHRLFNTIFQWQRLTIEGPFDSQTAPTAILRRLATVAGLPDPRVLLDHLNETRSRVVEIYGRVMRKGSA